MPTQGNQEKTPVKKLASLFEVRNTLLECDDLDKLVSRALELTRKKLNSQTASIFLFSKNGILEKYGISGINKNGEPIQKNWFFNEKYFVGESFTGKATQPQVNSKYGRPKWSNKLQLESINNKSKSRYLEELGELNCAIAVPLNGRHRTFGVLEVINKLPNKKNNSKLTNLFTPDDLYWLSIIGNDLASVISSLRRKNELELLANISQLLIKPFSGHKDPQDIYNNIAQNLSGEHFNYKACLIRIEDEGEVLRIAGYGGSKISWEDLPDESPSEGIGLAWKVFNSKTHEVIEDINTHQSEFRNIKWIKSNKLKSYICLPLTIKDKTIGTLSLFTGYIHYFYESDVRFLENIAFLVATIAESFNIINELKETKNDLSRERNKIFNTGRAVALQNSIHSVMHDHKHELLGILRDLELADESSPNRKSSIIKKQIFDIKKKINLLMTQMNEEFGYTAVDINKLIIDVVRFFKLEAKNSQDNMDFTFNPTESIPLIFANEAEIRDVIYNLISNAVKAIKKAKRKLGLVIIETKIITINIPFIQLSIEDNGIGIRNEDKGKIYEKGFTTDKSGTGTGLGLYITKNILNKYGGQMDFEATVGKGTKFTIRIPKIRNEV